MPMVHSLPIAMITREPRIQPREAISETAIEDYVQHWARIHDETIRQAGIDVTQFPPIVVFHERRDGEEFMWLADGWHRLLSAERAGLDTIDVEVHEGNEWDAALYAAGANGRHGLRRTSRDKRRAVIMLMQHPTVIREGWSDGRIALHAAVSVSLVKVIRAEHEQSLGIASPTVRLGADGKRYPVIRRGDQAGHTAPEKNEDTQNGTHADSSPVQATPDPSRIYECYNDGCTAISLTPMWHCRDCRQHWEGHWTNQHLCPSCYPEFSPLQRATILAHVTTQPLPPSEPMPRQEPYSPGLLPTPQSYKDLERVMTAIDLLLVHASPGMASLIAETNDRVQRVNQARHTLNDLADAISHIVTRIGVKP